MRQTTKKETTKKALKKRALNLTKELLAWLIEMPGGLVDAFWESRKGYFSQFHPQGQITLKQINRSLSELEKQRLIRKRQYRQKLIYEVTDLGKAKSLKWHYKRHNKKVRNDGLSTIVIFDIPESKKKSRDFLRRFLVQNEFHQLQESIYISGCYLLKEFNKLLNELKVTEHVTVLEGRVLYSNKV